MSAVEAGLRRVVIEFRPVVRVELAPLDDIGDEEAALSAIDTWSRLLAGADETGRPGEADWWGVALVDVAVVVRVQLVAVSWSVTGPAVVTGGR